MIKKIFSMFLVFVMVFGLGIGTTAFTAKAAPVNSMDVPVTFFDSEAAYTSYLEDLPQIQSDIDAKGATVLSASVIRSGSSSSCELYLNWTGDEMYSAFRFRQITVKSTSFLFPETYGTFGNGSSYTTKNVVASPIGSVKIGNVSIDSDVDRVSVSSSGLQGYNMITGSWLSALEFSGTVRIN